MGYFPVRYDSRVVKYDRKMFIRLATVFFNTRNRTQLMAVVGRAAGDPSSDPVIDDFGRTLFRYLL